MKAQYEKLRGSNEAVIRLEPETDLDRQLLLRLENKFTVTSMRASTGARDLLEVRLVRRG